MGGNRVSMQHAAMPLSRGWLGSQTAGSTPLLCASARFENSIARHVCRAQITGAAALSLAVSPGRIGATFTTFSAS